MNLNRILGPTPAEWAGLKVSGISEDSRAVCRGDLFFVRPGPNFDIFSVLKGLEHKAAAFVAPESARAEIIKLSLAKPVIFVDDLTAAYRKAVDIFYEFNKKDFKCIGVTGTNGKTTTTYLISHILNRLRHSAGLIGTIEYRAGNKSFKASHTTPDYLTLRRVFKEFRRHHVQYLVTEASSHGIEQGRLAGLDFRVCAFTNLTRDHLDYHKTMHKYFAAKAGLFKANPRAWSVINRDDHYGRILLKKVARPFSYGLSPESDLWARDVVFSPRGSEFTMVYRKQAVPVKIILPGRHNVYNALAAAGALLVLGFKAEEIARHLKSFRRVPGRLERVARDIYVDFAHTPDGLKKVLNTVRECGYRYIICVFGCGGERDHGKRPMMGHVAGELADFSVVTSDNPRHEDPATIIEQVKHGFVRKNYTTAVDREAALKIALALQRKNPGSCVVAAGKGHEEYQVIGDVKVPYSDRKVIQKIIRSCK